MHVLPSVAHCIENGTFSKWLITYTSVDNLIGYLPMNDVVAMEIGDAWQQLLSVTTEHGLVKTSKSAGRKNIKLTLSAQLMHYLLITIDQGVANNLTNSNAKCSSQNAKHQKTKQKQTIRRMRKGTSPSKYGGNGAPWNVLHEDVHHAPV